VRLHSIGCRLNTAEIESLARQLQRSGHQVVGPGEPADLYILNTCTVTSVAARKSRHASRRLRRDNQNARVVVIGCHAELSAAEIEDLGVDLVVGNRDKHRLTELLVDAGILPSSSSLPARFQPGSRGRTRAFVKIQEGCDHRCTYCIVSRIRGPAHSRPPAAVVAELAELEELGFREVVLTGVHLGSYGIDLGEGHGLAQLLDLLLEHSGIDRFRLSSLEPWDVQPELFELFSNGRVLPHLHLPLQSGSDRTLRRMARPITGEGYARLVERARSEIADLSVSTDVMVGFPGESDQDFEQSMDFVRRLAFSRLHVFRYSAREGTPAASFPDQLPAAISQDRSQRMLDLGGTLEESFNRGYLDRRVDVLWETSSDRRGRRQWSGLTDNYIRVHAGSELDLTNRVTATVITEVVPGGVRGRVSGPPR
jgi:threonylcarbamoyladenosine tRNA methylthiotransferase MtaB